MKYGNTPSLLIQPDVMPEVTKLSWLFEVVFDYGQGYFEAQPPDDQGRVFATASITGPQTWPVRQDPFSRYRSCFEVRTYRLCRRVLMFHHFDTEQGSPLGTPDCLVRATEFTYQETPIASFITTITQSGFVRQDDGIYLQRSLPALELAYSQAQVQNTVQDVDPESLVNLPASVDGLRYQWLDLDGEGLQCVLAEQDDAWYYKRNLSPLSLNRNAEQVDARFEALTEVSRLPALAEARAPRHQFMDLTGDGRLDCVVLDRPGAGFYERTRASWLPFTALPSAPNIDWSDPNLRFIDVDGDGYNDLLITEHEALTYYPSLAALGFGAPQRVPKATDEEQGPAIIFADSTQSIFLADMSGDGLADIVRIRNGEVCYWPNLGYGQFGQKVWMDQAPWFDAPDLFSQQRIRLADVDGSGVTDIIYLAQDDVSIYFNQSGNAWSAAESVMDYPPADNLARIQALDLLGNGTACLVWTSSLPGDTGRSMQYIDLMGGEKPYLLVRSANNLGAETRVSYAPSTAFYLADREAGHPWATRLPFPVQVVERVETDDRVSRNRFVTSYAYHHGYFDGVEREFRGFGMVEQQDTEELGVLSQSGVFPDATNIDAASYVPPVLTKTWFHTGVYPGEGRVSRIFAKEYYGDPGLSEQFPDSQFSEDLTGDEIHEALRSLKGQVLRQEVYALDRTKAACRPYSVSERNYTIHRIQPFGGNRHAVFFTHARESIDLHYERTLYKVNEQMLADPRVTHNMTLAVDDYGNELLSAAIAYGRRHDDPDTLLTPDDQAIQRTLHITYTARAYTNAILEPDAYRAPLPAEVSTYELIKVTPDPARNVPGVTNLFEFNELAGKIAQAADGLHDLPYEDVDATGATQDLPYRRIIEDVRTLYRADDLTGALALGFLQPMALPFAIYKLAFTPGLLALYQRGAENLLPDLTSVLGDKGEYALSDDQKTAGLFPASDLNGNWWIPSGQVFYSSDPTDTPALELAVAQAHFFVPLRYRDPFLNETIVTYDTPYILLPVSVQDTAQNTVTTVNDYRVLQPESLTDPNGNQSTVAFDGLGLVVGTAVMGKAAENLGDTLDVGFVADLTQSEIDQFFADPTGAPAATLPWSATSPAATLLGNATSRIVYDLGRYAHQPDPPAPAYAATITRETHVSKLGQGQTSRLQVSFSYSDGFGREIQRKMLVDPGPLTSGGPVVDPRWVGSGWTIFNNKGKPVRQYEPFFDGTQEFTFGNTVGVSATVFYDPLGRAVARLHPNTVGKRSSLTHGVRTSGMRMTRRRWSPILRPIRTQGRSFSGFPAPTTCSRGIHNRAPMRSIPRSRTLPGRPRSTSTRQRLSSSTRWAGRFSPSPSTAISQASRRSRSTFGRLSSSTSRETSARSPMRSAEPSWRMTTICSGRGSGSRAWTRASAGC